MAEQTETPVTDDKPNAADGTSNEGNDRRAIKDVLVPIDFSPGSLQALDYILGLAEPGGEVYLLHVIDSDFVERLSAEGFGDPDGARKQMRRSAEERLQSIARQCAASGIQVESMVVIGKPFAEILRVAADLDFNLIAMGTRGQHQGGIEEILFGSTEEKVLRATGIPVLCVPPART